MGNPTSILLDDVLPEDAWNQLAADPAAVLIDIRSASERRACGVPDLVDIGREVWTVEWPLDTGHSTVTQFLTDIMRKVARSRPERLFLLCSTGTRSRRAAEAIAVASPDVDPPLHLTGVLEGFDGIADPHGRRGLINGWRAADLPWRALGTTA